MFSRKYGYLGYRLFFLVCLLVSCGYLSFGSKGDISIWFVEFLGSVLRRGCFFVGWKVNVMVGVIVFILDCEIILGMIVMLVE